MSGRSAMRQTVTPGWLMTASCNPANASTMSLWRRCFAIVPCGTCPADPWRACLVQPSWRRSAARPQFPGHAPTKVCGWPHHLTPKTVAALTFPVAAPSGPSLRGCAQDWCGSSGWLCPAPLTARPPPDESSTRTGSPCLRSSCGPSSTSLLSVPSVVSWWCSRIPRDRDCGFDGLHGALGCSAVRTWSTTSVALADAT